LTISALGNRIQRYAWGSVDAIPRLLGRDNPGGAPWAEMWMGAHHRAPSRVWSAGRWSPLPELIDRDPRAILGEAALARFGVQLPFLFKVLAAARPLSIQCHPDAARAAAGFERENAAGIPLDAPARCYRDPHPKPELLCALSRFSALVGFQAPRHIIENFSSLRSRTLTPLLTDLRVSPEGGLPAFFRALMTLPMPDRRSVLSDLRRAHLPPPIAPVVHLLIAAYPDDLGALAPLYLNHVLLAPGEAIFLPPGELHAYLEGLALELMAGSDNVLRGGLTQKHIDVPQLLDNLSFRTGRPPVLHPLPIAPGLEEWRAPTDRFSLSRVTVSGEVPVAQRQGVEIVLCVAGDLHLRGKDTEHPMRRGDAALIPASVGGYRVTGAGTLYRAALPAPP